MQVVWWFFFTLLGCITQRRCSLNKNHIFSWIQNSPSSFQGLTPWYSTKQILKRQRFAPMKSRVMSFLYALLTVLRILNSTISRSLQLKLPWASHSHQHFLVDENKVQHNTSPWQLLSHLENEVISNAFQEFLLCCPSKRCQAVPWGPGFVDMRPLLSVFRGVSSGWVACTRSSHNVTYPCPSIRAHP